MSQYVQKLTAESLRDLGASELDVLFLEINSDPQVHENLYLEEVENLFLREFASANLKAHMRGESIDKATLLYKVLDSESFYNDEIVGYPAIEEGFYDKQDAEKICEAFATVTEAVNEAYPEG